MPFSRRISGPPTELFLYDLPSHTYWYCVGLVTNGPIVTKILVDLIEEDFTSRAFDNVRSIHSLAKVVLQDYHSLQNPHKSEEDYVVSHLDFFFKYRNKAHELEQLAIAQEESAHQK